MSTISKYTFVGMLSSMKPPTVEAVVDALKTIGFDLETDDELTPVAGCPTRLSQLTSSSRFMTFETNDRYLTGRLNQFVKGQKPTLHEGKHIFLVPRTAPRFTFEKSLFLLCLEFELPPNQQTCIFSREVWDGKEHKLDWMIARIDEHMEEARQAFRLVCRDVKTHVRYCLHKQGLPRTYLD